MGVGVGERGPEVVLLAVGKEEAGQEPQTRSRQSEMCLKGRKNRIGKASGLPWEFCLSFPAVCWVTTGLEHLGGTREEDKRSFQGTDKL